MWSGVPEEAVSGCPVCVWEAVLTVACIATGSAQRSQRGRPRAGHSRPGGAGLAASEESEAAQP